MSRLVPLRFLADFTLLSLLFVQPSMAQQKDSAVTPKTQPASSTTPTTPYITSPTNEVGPARPDNQGKAPIAPSSTGSALALSANTAIAQAPPAPRWHAILDAGHGGSDHGGHLSEKLSEKEFNLQVARKLHTELQNRGISVLMLRDGDTAPSLEQRAIAANNQHAGFYIGIHSTLSGSGVHIYYSLLNVADPFPSKEQMETEKKLGPFHTWDSIQRSQFERSKMLALEITSQLKLRKLHTAALTSSVRPLANINFPAVIIEISPPEPGSIVDKMTANSYLQAIVQALASAIIELHGKNEEPR